jgi:multidrug efflux system membrane fusion protein
MNFLNIIFRTSKSFLEKMIARILRKESYSLSKATTALILIGLLVLLMIAYRSYTTKQDAKNTSAKNRPVSVVIDSVKKGDITVIQTSLGTVTPRNIINVQNQVSGILTHVYFKEGDDVKEGQLLAQIDSRQLEASVKQAQGTLDRDKMLLQNARTDLKRYDTLLKQDSISNQVYDTQKALVEQYAGVVLADQGALDAAKVQLDYTKIRSPINGRIGLRLVDPGNYVQSNSGNLFVVTQIRPTTVVFTIPQDLLPTYRHIIQANKEHRPAADNTSFSNVPENAIEVEAWDSANKVLLSKGRLDSIDNVINLSTGTVNLKAVFDNDDGNLFPNQFVNIKTILEVKKDVLTIPIKAVQMGTPGTFVYKLNPDQTVSVVTVKLGAKDKDLVLLESGLDINDKVVVEGTDKLREGAKVIIGVPTPGSLAEQRGSSKKDPSSGGLAKSDLRKNQPVDKKAE